MLLVRAVQLIVLIAGLFAFGLSLGIEGVAIVMNLVLLAELIPLLHAAREHVDLSVWRLFGAPAIALIIGIAAPLGITYWVCPGFTCPNHWITGFSKSIAFSLAFVGTIGSLEGKEALELIGRVTQIWRGKPMPGAYQSSNPE